MDYNNNTHNQFNPEDQNVQNNQNGQFDQNGQFNPNQQYNPNGQYYQNGQYNPNGQYNQVNQYNMNPEYQQQMAQLREDDKKANTLCLISIACTILGYILVPMFGGVRLPDFVNDAIPVELDGFVETVQGATSMAVGLIAWLGQIAGFVLMIIARVKYPKNTFAKVLMWIYIVSIVLWVLAVILLIASCMYCASQCSGF